MKKKITREKNMVVIMLLTTSNNSGVLKNGTITVLKGCLLYISILRLAKMKTLQNSCRTNCH